MSTIRIKLSSSDYAVASDSNLPGDLGSAPLPSNIATATFSYFKYYATGTTLSDDEALALAIRTVGPKGGTLVIDDGLTITLTHMVDVPYAMTISSQAGGKDLGSLITGSVPGDLFHVEASAKILGLNFRQESTSGSILVLSGDDALASDCTFSNASGNVSTMVLLEGSGQVLQDDYFSNYEAKAFCWGATADANINANSSIVGGWAYGPGQGGWVGLKTSTVAVTDFTVQGWDCITTGAVQLELNAANSVRITGGVYDQSTGSAIVVGGGSYRCSDVEIDNAYVSTAGNTISGIAISVAPDNGAGVDGLTITGSDICCTDVAVATNAKATDVGLVGNTINACSVGLDLGGVTGSTTLTSNQNTASTPYVGMAATPPRDTTATLLVTTPPPSATLAQGLQTDTSIASAAVTDVGNWSMPAVPLIAASPTFHDFKVGADGTVLSDTDALERAIAWFATRDGTLVIDHGTTLVLTRTVDIPSSMQIVSDGSSLIESDVGGDMIDVTAPGSVLLQGLKFRNNGPSGSVVLMGGNGTVLRDDAFSNVLGNSSDMVRFGGPNELLEDCDFVNSDANAYCWSAPYVNAGGQVDINSSVRGGSASGVGNGGFVGAATSSGRVEGFEIDDWDCSTTGATQVDCTDVLSLRILGGTYSGASEAVIKLGGGLLGCLSVSIQDATLSGNSNSVGIDAAPSGGTGVTALVIDGDDITGSQTGVQTNIGCGGVSIVNNSIKASSVGLEVDNTNAAALVSDNYVDAPVALSATVAEAPWASQSYTGNVFDGAVIVSPGASGSYKFVGNSGASSFADTGGAVLQPSSPTLNVLQASGELTFRGAADYNDFLSVVATVGTTSWVIGTTVAGTDGAWSLTATGLAIGTYSFSAVASDAIGNFSTPSSNVVADFDPLFDQSYYLAHYGAQVAASGLSAYQHFLQVGWKQGLNPDAWFDTSFYLKQNPDVAASGVNPLLQYEATGWREGRTPSLLFSGAAYLAANPASAGTDPLVDFVQSGAAAAGTASYAPGQGTTADPLVQAAYVFPQWSATLLPTTNQAAEATAVFKAGGWRTMANPDPLFDTTFYMNTHRAEVLASGLDPLTHYETVGWREGYDPSLLFSTQAYLAAHPAVATSGVDPLTWSMTTAAQNSAAPQALPAAAPAVKIDPLLDVASVAQQIATLIPSGGATAAAVNKAYQQGAWANVAYPNQLFDSHFYLASNPDVAAANMDPLAHYEAFGAQEGRNPNPLFDDSYYLAANPDVRAAGVNPLLHFEQSGAFEGRNPDPLFDTKYYLSHNPDVAASSFNPLAHFEDFGWKEGRNPDALFDTKYYLAHNPDVAASGMDPLVHYDEFGWREGRNPSATFNTNAYLKANPDVKAAGVDPLAHYFASGQAEGRAIYVVP